MDARKRNENRQITKRNTSSVSFGKVLTKYLKQYPTWETEKYQAQKRHINIEILK
jgi:hypothetical protein